MNHVRVALLAVLAPLFVSTSPKVCAQMTVPASVAAPARQEQVLAPGLHYRHIRSATPQGEPWSIHVLEMDRRQKHLRLHMQMARGEQGEMQRELPTRLAVQASRSGAAALAVVNGDYDIMGDFMGVSDGLSIEGGNLWTTGQRRRPVMALSRAGKPVIAVPEVAISLQAGKLKWNIEALNKPMTPAYGDAPRLFTRELRPKLRSATPFGAVVIERLSAKLPLPANGKVYGRVTKLVGSATELEVPPDTLVLAGPVFSDATVPKTSIALLRPGQKVKITIATQVADVKPEHAVGGFPILVKNGVRNIVGEPGEGLAKRHPRTATCYNEQKIIFAVVDGRQPKLSVGMTLDELADLMVSLGCSVAMNTDGGGSSVMAIDDATQTGVQMRIVNSPSDGKERGRGDAWVVLSNSKSPTSQLSASRQ